MSRLVVDSWAWLEFFKGTARGALVKRYLTTASSVNTPATNLYEVLYRTLEDEGTDAASKAGVFIENHSHIIAIDKQIASAAVDVRREEKLHAIDALALAAARMLEAKLLTGDPHFRGKKGVLFIE